jgi:hypothetical protein
MKKLVARVTQLLIGVAIGIVWIQSAAAHASNPYFFLGSIYKYKLIGPGLGPLVAAGLPALQLVLAICLLARVFVGGALLGSALLLSAFAAIQLSAFARGLTIDCGCFGPASSTPIGESSVATVICLALAAFAALGCFCYSSNGPEVSKGTLATVSHEALA